MHMRPARLCSASLMRSGLDQVTRGAAGTRRGDGGCCGCYIQAAEPSSLAHATAPALVSCAISLATTFSARFLLVRRGSFGKLLYVIATPGKAGIFISCIFIAAFRRNARGAGSSFHAQLLDPVALSARPLPVEPPRAFRRPRARLDPPSLALPPSLCTHPALSTGPTSVQAPRSQPTRPPHGVLTRVLTSAHPPSWTTRTVAGR